MVRVDLSRDTVDVLIDDDDDAEIEWQVVSIPGARVETDLTFFAADSSAEFANPMQFDPARALLVYSMTTGGDSLSDIADRMISGTIEDSETIQFTRGLTDPSSPSAGMSSNCRSATRYKAVRSRSRRARHRRLRALRPLIKAGRSS